MPIGPESVGSGLLVVWVVLVVHPYVGLRFKVRYRMSIDLHSHGLCHFETRRVV